MANKNYEYHALGSYKEKLFQLFVKDEKSDLLIDILMPVIEDSRFPRSLTRTIKMMLIRLLKIMFLKKMIQMAGRLGPKAHLSHLVICVEALDARMVQLLQDVTEAMELETGSVSLMIA